MHLDPAMLTVVIVVFSVLVVAMALQMLRLPSVVAYIVAGAVIGPSGLGVVSDSAMVERMGSFGVVLLLFFVGMEVSPQSLAKNWRVPVLGTLLQVIVSVGVAAFMGWRLSWPVGRMVLVGFVISLSSTAVVLKILEDRGAMSSRFGLNAVGVLLVQDVLVVPMLVVVGALSGDGASAEQMIRQSVGAVVIAGMVGLLMVKKRIHLPFAKFLSRDQELQVFAALSLCFAFAAFTGVLELSAALGGFVAGMLVGGSEETEWVHESLHPFRVVFVSLFFLSVGMFLDVGFLFEHIGVVLTVVLAALGTNTLVNGVTFRMLGEPWRASFFSGALLAQMGEFGFLLAAMGRDAEIVTEYGFQLVVTAISVSLVLSPVWIAAVGALLRVPRESIRDSMVG